MAKKKPDKPTTQRTDPRLKSFLRKAAAIITVEKGLNAESQRKLQALADRDQLPAELFQEALSRLQSSSASTSNLSHYERAFVTFLDTEIEKISGGIVSPRVEQEAIKLAKLKYEINGTRAQQLIDARAEAAGIELISHQEAIAYANQLIVEQIGDASEIDDNARAQLYQFGRRWRLDVSDVDRIISGHVGRNRAIRHRGYLMPVGITTIVLLVTVTVAFTAYSKGWIFNDWRSEPIGNNNSSSSIADATINTTRFSDSLFEEFEQFVTRDPAFKSSLQRIFDDDKTQRSRGYQSFVTIAIRNRSGNPRRSEMLLSKLYHQDPDEESMQAVVATLENAISSRTVTTSTVQDLKDAYQANRILGKLYFGDTDASGGIRKRALANAIESTVQVPSNELSDYDDFLEASQLQIANEQWNRLFQTAWREPTQASVILEPLIELTRTRLPDDTLNGYRDDAVVAILRNDVSRWKVLQNQIRETIETTDASRLSEWISIFESTNDSECQVEIGSALLPRLGIRANSRRREDIVEAISKFNLSTRNAGVRPIIERSKKIDQLFATSMDSKPSTTEPATPDQIAHLALLTNIEWAFCLALEDATHINDESFSEVDRLIGLPTPGLRELISLPIDRKIATGEKASSAMASDNRRLENAIHRIGNQDVTTNGLKMLALRDLSQISHRFEDISYVDAQTIAAFLLSSVEREELLGIEQLIDSFSHWSNLALAIADQVPNSNTKIDQALTIARLLLHRDFELGRSDDWKMELQQSILAAVSSDVASQVQLDPDTSKSDWNRLRIYLLDLYRERFVASNQITTNLSFTSPHQWIQQLTALEATGTDRNELNSALALNESFNSNEIEKTVFANQLLAGVLARALAGTEFEVSANEIAESLSSKLNSPSFAGDKLYATELALLKILEFRRRSNLNRLLNREDR